MDENNNLQELFRRISLLKNDLSAEIVIREEEGYWGPPNRRFHTEERGCYDSDEESGWYVTVPKIAEPIIPKREAAASELKLLYDTSEWYIARYEAGLALLIQGLTFNQLEADAQKWKVLLINDLKLPKKGHPENVQKINKALEELKYFHISGFDLFKSRHKIVMRIITTIKACTFILALLLALFLFLWLQLYGWQHGSDTEKAIVFIFYLLGASVALGVFIGLALNYLTDYLRKKRNQVG